MMSDIFVVFCHFSSLKWKMFTDTVTGNDLNVHILDDFSIKILKIVAVTILDIFTVK